MPIGIILGVILTILGAYIHDSMVTGPTVTGQTPPASSRQIVNWDVAGQKWTSVKQSVRTTWNSLQNSTSKL
jgi:hypothetical protein